MKKENCMLGLLTIIIAAMLSVGFVSCGDDDDDDITSASELIDKLQVTMFAA